MTGGAGLGISNTQYNLVNVIDTGSSSPAMQTACTVNGVYQGGQGVSYAMGTPTEMNGLPTFVGGNGCNSISDPGAGPMPGPAGQVTNIYDAVYTAVLNAISGGKCSTTGTCATQAANTAANSGAGDGTTPSNNNGGGGL